MEKSQITTSAQETQNIGTALARKILRQKPGKQAVVLALYGDLGAGKTTFLQGFARGLGVGEVVNSPTFIVMKRFKIDDVQFKNFYHIDCYRLEKPEELLQLRFEEIVKSSENVVAIEWPEKISKLLPKEYISITFNHLAGDRRKIVVQ